MSYVNFNRALTKAQIEALGEAGTAVNGKIYFATDDGIYVGNADGSVSLKANAGGDITSEPLGPIDDPTNAYYTRTQTDTLLLGKQDVLVSGTNIKTINNNSLLGSGNITIDPNNTFIARYNVTSFADVKAAYLAGKTVVCLYWSIASGDGEDIYLTLYNYYTDDGPGYEYFTFTGINDNHSYIIYLNEDNDTWRDVNISLAYKSDLNNRVLYHNTNYQSVKLYGGFPVGYGSLTLYGGRVIGSGSLTMGYASNNTNTTNNSIQATNTGSFAGGYSTQNAGIVANSSGSIAFGYNNTSGTKILANNNGATAMGVTSILYDGTTYSGNLDASGEGSHAEGCASRTEGVASHVEGVLTYADAVAAHAEGFGTVASNDAEHAEGKWNVSNANTISSIGIGTADNDRKNAFEVKSTGAVYIKGVGTYDGTNPVSGTNDVKSIIDSKAPLASPTLTGTPTAPTAAAGTNTTQVATTAFVKTAIDELPEPMIFKGSLGTGGTITTLPAASSSNEGYTYKVITAGTYAGQTTKVGDTFISTGTEWVLIPSGDEPSGTVTNIATGTGLTGGPITTSGTISHVNSGVTAGTYKSVTVNAMGHVTAGTNPTTLDGYGITDGVRYNDVLQPTNPFGGKLLYINSIDNALASANKKFWVTVTKHNKVADGVEYPYINSSKTSTDDDYFVDSPVISTYNGDDIARLFDGSYESQLTTTPGTYIKVHIQFAPFTNDWTPSSTTKYFEGYPYGQFYLNYYYTYTPGRLSQLRVYNKHSGTGLGWKLIDATLYRGALGQSGFIEQISDETDYSRSCLEFIIFGNNSTSAVNTSLTQIDYKLSRPNLSKDGATVTKYSDQKLYHNFYWYKHNDNAEPTQTVRINPWDGEITTNKFIKTNGTSSQFLKADGSVDSTSYVSYTNTTKKSVTLYGGTSSGNGSLVLYNGNASGNGSFVQGYSSGSNQISATNAGAMAGGYSTISNGILASGQGSLAFGYNTRSGKQIKASGTGSIAMGSTVLDTIEATGNYSVAIGSNNHATNTHTYAIGWGNTASFSGAVAIGCGALASGENAISISGNATAIGAKSIGGTASGAYSISIGNGVRATRDNAVAIGKHNKYDSNTQFSIGNGTADDARSNLLEIYNDKFYVKGLGTYNGTNPSSGVNDLGTLLNQKQEVLVSGTNIKTINNQSLLGSGNINIGERYLEIWDNGKIMNFSSNISITTSSLLNTEPFKTLYNNLANFRNGVYSGLRVYRYYDYGSGSKEITETLTMTLLGCNYDDNNDNFKSLYFEGAYLSDPDNMVMNKRILKLAANTYDGKFLGSIFSLRTDTPQTASTMILTQAQYDALTTKDPNTLYIIKVN